MSEIALAALGELREVAGIATMQLAEILQDERATVRFAAAHIPPLNFYVSIAA